MSRRPALALALALAISAGLAGCAGSGPAPSGTPSASATPIPGAMPATSLAAGDCFDPIDAATVAKLPCTMEHRYEAFATFVLDDAAYPAAALGDEVRPKCIEAFSAFVGIGYDASALTLRTIAPSAATWADGDREAICVVTDPAGPVTGSLRSTAR